MYFKRWSGKWRPCYKPLFTSVRTICVNNIVWKPSFEYKLKKAKTCTNMLILLPRDWWRMLLDIQISCLQAITACNICSIDKNILRFDSWIWLSFPLVEASCVNGSSFSLVWMRGNLGLSTPCNLDQNLGFISEIQMPIHWIFWFTYLHNQYWPIYLFT